MAWGHGYTYRNSFSMKDLEEKDMTIDELREQFENSRKGFWLERYKNGDYMDDRLDSNWDSYLECAVANNIIKDGE